MGEAALRVVVTLEEGTGPSLVNRIARQRQVLLSANVQVGFSSQAVIDALNAKVAELAMPAGYIRAHRPVARAGEVGGGVPHRARPVAHLHDLILAAHFKSWVDPVSILLALPLTVPFALLSCRPSSSSSRSASSRRSASSSSSVT